MSIYDRKFYEQRYEDTKYSAESILSILLSRLPKIESAIDVGCGVGAWLSVLKDKGIKDIQGVDGSWVDQDLLAISPDDFKEVDIGLLMDLGLPKKYDLAISLEVAEHLSAGRAKDFVTMLVELSDLVLFSAAIPGQDGVGHVNEQWQSYWVDLFRACGYTMHDFIRPLVWNDSLIPFWYRQNILVFSRSQGVESAQSDSNGHAESLLPVDLVHPELYLMKSNLKKSRRSGFRRLFRLPWA